MSLQNGLIPMQRVLASALSRALLPRFETSARFRLNWDYKAVAALQEDEEVKARRMGILVEKGILKRSEARSVSTDATKSTITNGTLRSAATARNRSRSRRRRNVPSATTG